EAALALEAVVDDAIAVVVDPVAAFGQRRLFADARPPHAVLALALPDAARATPGRPFGARVALPALFVRARALGRAQGLDLAMRFEHGVRARARRIEHHARREEPAEQTHRGRVTSAEAETGPS